MRPATPAAVIVAFRDSITDGTGSTLGAHDRWEDILALRLALQETGRWALVNEGIGGNTLPPKVNALIVPVSAAPRTRGPMLALSNTTGPSPNVLSTRTLTLSAGIVTRAIMRTVAFVILVAPSPCCDVPHAVTQAGAAF